MNPAPLRFVVGIFLLYIGLASLFAAQDNNESIDKPVTGEQTEGAQPDSNASKADNGEEEKASDENNGTVPKEPEVTSPVATLDDNATGDDDNGSKSGDPTTETGEIPEKVKPSNTTDGNTSDTEAAEVETDKPVVLPGADEDEEADNNVTLDKGDGNSTTPLDKQPDDDSLKFLWLGLALVVVIYLFVRNRGTGPSDSDEFAEPYGGGDGDDEPEDGDGEDEDEEDEEPEEEDVSSEPEDARQTPPEESSSPRLEASFAAPIASALHELANRQTRESSELKSSIDEVKEGFTILQGALDEKDQEIRRLRTGFDAEVFRRFLKRFIRVDDALAYEIKSFSEDDSKTRLALSEVREILQDAFYECGLEDFTPEVGAKIKDAFGTNDNPKVIPAETPEQELTIAEVYETGYLLRTPDGNECVKPAKIIAYGKMEK